MINKSRKDRRARKKLARRGILGITIALAVIVGTTVVSGKFFGKDKKIQTVQAENNSNNEPTSDGNVNKNNSEEDKNENGNKADEKANKNEIREFQNDTSSDTPQFIEKYISQQSKGQMPEGADGKKVVYLTFDDGPSETVTPKVLEVLKEKGVHATFFVVGQAVDADEKSKELLKKEHEEGHAIGNHSYSHNYKVLYPNRSVNVENFMAEVDKTNKSIRSVLGEDFPIRAVRFPGGHISWKNTQEIDEVFKEKGYASIDWNALSKDAEGPKKNAEQLFEETKKSVGSKEKVVLLMHDTYGKEETAKALPSIIDYLKENGYEFKVIQ